MAGDEISTDEAYDIIRHWLDGKDRDLRAYEALDNLWLAAKLREDPTFDWTTPRPNTDPPGLPGRRP